MLIISFIFAKLDGGRNFESLEHVIEAITFNIILSYLIILPFVIVEKYIQRPTDRKIKKYFILSSLVSLLVTIIVIAVVIFTDTDGYAIMLAPFYIIPTVFVYTFIRMIIWYKFSLSTDKIMRLKYYVLGLFVLFFVGAFYAYELMYKFLEIILLPVAFLFEILGDFADICWDLINSVFPW